MIILEYNPHAGIAIRDGEADTIAAEAVARNSANTSVHIVFATENLLHAIRVCVRKGDLSCQDLEIRFGEHRPRVYPSGGIAPWPDGFCDYIERWLMELL